MAKAVDVSDPAPPMRVERNNLPRCNARMNNPHWLVFQQKRVMRKRRHQRVERFRPGPLGSGRKIIVMPEVLHFRPRR